MTVWKTALAFTIGLAAFAFSASTAEAGFEFTDTATVGGGNLIAGGDAVYVNGVGASLFLGSVAMNNGFEGPAVSGPDLVTFTGSSGGSSSGNNTDLRTIVLNFDYTLANSFTPGLVSAGYHTVSGEPMYTMVVEFGDITIAPGGSVTLLQVGFSEANDNGGYNSYIVNQAITATNANLSHYITVPGSGFNSVATSLRDQVDSVQLIFQFQGIATSVGINAVVNPEPGTLALFGFGFLGLAGLVRRRRKNRKGPAAAA